MARSTESSLKDMKTWADRLGHTGLRSFTDADGHLWVEQNRTKASKWAKLARKGHERMSVFPLKFGTALRGYYPPSSDPSGRLGLFEIGLKRSDQTG